MSPFFLVGPTAIGKTRLAVELAERCGAEIVSADALQIYDGLETLTARPSADLLRRARHHLIGCVPLAESFNVAAYASRARACLADIAARDRPAIVTGGTGLYVKALTHGLAPLPAANHSLRAELDKLDLPTLVSRLEALDPAAALVIDRKNKRRLVRAVEICLLTGEPVNRSGWKAAAQAGGVPKFTGVFLFQDRSEMHERIARRVAEMFERGVVAEVRNTPPETIGPTAARALGLAEVQMLLRDEISENECRRRIETATRQYAKRQVTWFKREQGFERMDVTGVSATDVVNRLAERMTNDGMTNDE